MSLTVGNLYHNAISSFNLSLLAGQDGLEHTVEWVHIVESIEVSEFLRGNELVFTAGYLNDRPDWLLDFVKTLYKANAAALFVNIGPYIKGVDDDVIKYCNEVGFPLFSVPWQSRLVDITRYFSRRIIHNEKVERNVSMSMKNLIFKTGDRQESIKAMQRFGYVTDSKFSYVNITVESVDNDRHQENIRAMKRLFEQLAGQKKINIIWLTYENNIICVLTEGNFEKVRKFCSEASRATAEKYSRRYHLFCGVSDIAQGYDNQLVNFEKSVKANYMAVKQKKRLVFHTDLDFYKLLLDVKDKDLLREYYDEILKPLENYDAKNHTKLTEFLQIYLGCNGSPAAVAERISIHRNTVANQVKKIEHITGCNLLSLDDKVRYVIAFAIRDLF
jgi:predicted DNA-binding protein YlxM (UPF0122 family)/glutaredoxin-related protein